MTSAPPANRTPKLSEGRVREASADRIVVEVEGWPGHAPGQFAMLGLHPRGQSFDPLLPRPMAIFRHEAGAVEFRFKVVGRGTAALAQLVPGTAIGVLGPLGRGFPAPPQRTLLVGGGTGIASLYELALAHRDRVHVLLGGRSRRDIMALDAFLAAGVSLAVATEDGSCGHRGLVTELLDPASDDTVLTCGPTPMMRRVAELAQKAGARCVVSLESQMACGIGICLGCSVVRAGGPDVAGRRPFAYVCTDGPVFDASDLDWERLP